MQPNTFQGACSHPGAPLGMFPFAALPDIVKKQCKSQEISIIAFSKNHLEPPVDSLSAGFQLFNISDGQKRMFIDRIAMIEISNYSSLDAGKFRKQQFQ